MWRLPTSVLPSKGLAMTGAMLKLLFSCSDKRGPVLLTSTARTGCRGLYCRSPY